MTTTPNNTIRPQELRPGPWLRGERVRWLYWDAPSDAHVVAIYEAAAHVNADQFLGVPSGLLLLADLRLDREATSGPWACRVQLMERWVGHPWNRPGWVLDLAHHYVERVDIETYHETSFRGLFGRPLRYKEVA